MDKKTAVEIAKQYTDAIIKHFPVKAVLLYGSFARGDQREDSDIDIAVVVDKLAKDFLEEYTDLFKLRRGINSRIEPVLLEANEDHSGFLQSVLEQGEIIYPAAA